jgi:uncharacterized membrane protein
VTLLTSLLPWAHTGRRSRTGVELVRLSRSLHLATRTPAKFLLVAVCAAPLVLAGGWVAWAANRGVMARILSAVTGAVAVAGAIGIATSSLSAAFGAVLGGGLGCATVVIAMGHWNRS